MMRTHACERRLAPEARQGTRAAVSREKFAHYLDEVRRASNLTVWWLEGHGQLMQAQHRAETVDIPPQLA
jgi:hypothetical protein